MVCMILWFTPHSSGPKKKSNAHHRMWVVLILVGMFIPLSLGTVVSRDGSRSDMRSNPIPSDFVVATEDGILHGFDDCGNLMWESSLGRTLVNATDYIDSSASSGARMVPAIDGSLYVVFPPDDTGQAGRIAHVNATIMSIVAESPFSTPAFPNSYLTGSKIQTLGSFELGDEFGGWKVGSDHEYRERLNGKRVIFSLNEWTLSCIDTSSQSQRWSLSFCELPPLTQSHLNPSHLEYFQVTHLANEIEIERSVFKRLPAECSSQKDARTVRELKFLSQVLGVYALLEPIDAAGNLVMVLVGKNSPIPTTFGGLPDSFEFLIQELSGGSRIDYTSGSAILHPYSETKIGGGLPITRYDHGSVTPYNPSEYYLAIPGGVPRAPLIDTRQVVSEFRVIDFLRIKFAQLSLWMKLYVILMGILSIVLVRKVYNRVMLLVLRRDKGAPLSKGNSHIQILLPDGTQLHQTLPDQAIANGPITISSPASGSNRLVLIPSEAIQPYEVVKVGQQDSVEFLPWQRSMDVESFDKKIKDISQRLTKLPFTHSAKESNDATSRRPSLDSGNATVLFLGRNVDEPKLVFRNPRAESEIQRANIPVFTQSIRNAVAASALRDSPQMRAYVPRALCGSWNTFQGVFQEYIPKNKTVNVSVQSFRESPQSAVDTAILVMLLRDTDAHDGNYIRDLRRKIALFDLGCCLADQPLPKDSVERMCLDNFEIWKRVPYLLNVEMEDRHKEYIESINFQALRAQWTLFEYQDSLVEMAKNANSRLIHPTVMLRIMEVHAKFLKACISAKRTVLFAAEVLYSGLYDDIWLEVGLNDVQELEKRLLDIAVDGDENQLFPHLKDVMAAPESPKNFSSTDAVDSDTTPESGHPEQ